MENYCGILKTVISICIIFNGCWANNSGTGPVFILEPPNYVIFSNSRGAVINCLVHGDPDPSVTWITSTGDELKNLQNFLKILRNNSLEFLTFSNGNFQQNVHSNEYRCKASNKYGTVVSSLVDVKAFVDQQYSTQVYDEYVIEGNTAVFKCHIPSYIKDYVEVSAWIRNDQFRIPKKYVKGSRYYITEVGNLHVSEIDRLKDSKSTYKCETKHKASGKTMLSEKGAGLHITRLSSSIPPKIIDILSNVYTTAGEMVVLPCVAQAFPYSTYSWCKQNQETGKCPKLTEGKSNGERISLKDGYLIMKTDSGDTGSYKCTLTNEMGQEEAVTKLHVFSPISVYIHPQGQKVDIGQSVTLDCVISGGPISFIEWTKNGEILRREQDNISKNSTRYHIESVSTSSDGMYQCFVGNQFGRKQASSQLLLSAIPPDLTQTFDSKLIRPGSSFTLKCEAKGDPLPEISWQLRNTVLKKAQGTIIERKIGYNGIIISKLSKSNVNRFDGGIYSCTAKNKAGSRRHSNNINVYGPLHVWPIVNKTVIAGESFTIQCHVSGFPVEKISWLKDGRILIERNHIQLKSNGSIIISNAVKHRDEGRYICEAEDGQRSTSSGIGVITIIEKPTLDSWNEEKILNSRGRLHLLCSIHEGDPPIDFSWTFNGKPVPHELQTIESDSAYSSALTASNIGRAHSGKYSCIAENKAGRTSESIQVLVRASPEWEHKPKTVVATLQENVLLPCSGKGYPKTISFWYKLVDGKKKQLTNNSRIMLASDGSLTIQEVLTEDFTSILYCVISNGIPPDLSAEVNISSNTVTGQRILFSHIKNTFQQHEKSNVLMKCTSISSSSLTIEWLHSSRIMSSSSRRIKIMVSKRPNEYESILEISNLKLSDSGLYTCRASAGEMTNSTRMFLSVTENQKINRWKNGNVSRGNKNLISSNTSLSNGNEKDKNGIRLYGMALLYVIPTMTAAIVLLVILVIVCILLQRQKRRHPKLYRPNTDTIRSRTSTKSYDKQDYMNKYGNNSEDFQLSSMSNKYDTGRRSNRLSSRDYHIYSDMMSESSTLNHPKETLEIQPYAEFTADDPVRFPANCS